jgi:hypothetical protein
MSIDHNPYFPLLASDQADVINLFLQLMSEGDRVVGASEITANQPVDWRTDSDGFLFPGDPFDI